MTINQRITALRKIMNREQVAAYIIPSSDAHQSEYVADYAQGRAWISGFDGSAGIVVVTADHAGVWTDSRYYLQAEEQLSDSEFVMHKQHGGAIPEHVQWLVDTLQEGDVIAIDGALFSKKKVDYLTKIFAQKNIVLDSSIDLLSPIWTDRPEMPRSKIYELEVKYCGKSREDKLTELRSFFQSKADCYIISALDDIAYLFNLRGADVESNPVFIAYAIVEAEKAIIFVDQSKLDQQLKIKLLEANILIEPYDSIFSCLNDINESTRVMLDPGDVNMHIYRSINGRVVESKNFIRAAKAVKNTVEIANTRKVMEKDGVALVRLYRWIEQNESNSLKETDIAAKLIELRGEQEWYVGESFPAIVGFRGNGAIVHYRPIDGKCAVIEGSGMLLIDSGGQFFEGTTDTTRTLYIGTPSEEEMRAYTLVLKGHIALDKAVFLKGTTGAQLDILARQFLWQHGLNYGHGTGHGVGYFMNVHEPPQGFVNSLRGSRGTTSFEVGMITSNEPGFYKKDEFGIRIENLVLTQPYLSTEYGTFYNHETLTLAPIETKLIDKKLFTADETEWLNEYHREVFNRLSPHLLEEEKDWLKTKCQAI